MACSLLALGVLLWAVYRYVYLPARARFRDTELALRLQRRFPDLDDRLVSAVFLFSKDETLEVGSARRFTPADLRVVLSGHEGVVARALHS